MEEEKIDQTNTEVNESPKENDKGKKSKKNIELEQLNQLALANQQLMMEKAGLTDKILRLTAEMQNMSRRYEAEKADIYKYEGEKIIKQLLPIIDNFERAVIVDETKLSEDLQKFLSGFKMIYVNMLNIINSFGVKEIDALNKEFNPELMEAITTEHIEGTNPGIVTLVMQKGYIYNDKVIRHAMVKVSE